VSQVLAADAVEAWEERFGPLTQDERDLLTDPLAGRLREQQRHVLMLYMQPMECPACQALVPARQALGRPIDHKSVEDAFTCPSCRRALIQCVPFVGREFWRLRVPLGPATDAELGGEADG
jgi:hypothetical protein